MNDQTYAFAIGDDVRFRETEKMFAIKLACRQGRIQGFAADGRLEVILHTGATYIISAEDLELV